MILRIRVEIYANSPGGLVGEGEIEVEADLPTLELLGYQGAFERALGTALVDAGKSQGEGAPF